MRAIFLPAYHRWITIPQYITIVKRAKANPDKEFSGTLNDWTPGTGEQIVQEFLSAVHDRINQGIPYSQRLVYPRDAADWRGAARKTVVSARYCAGD